MPGLIEDYLAAGPSRDQVSDAFWHACHAGQRRAAKRLARAGADLNYVPGDIPETLPRPQRPSAPSVPG